MSMFDYITIAESIDLPHFPGWIDHSELDWQTKELRCIGEDYRVTSDGRLEVRRRNHREKTAEERQQEAEDNGFDSWFEYKGAFEEALESGSPIEVWDDVADGDEPFPFTIYDRKVDKEWWSDEDYHGSFEIHAHGKRIDNCPDVFFSYEFRFNKGDLEDVVLLGGRGSGESVEDIVEQIESYDDTR